MKPNPEAIVKNVFDLAHATGQEVKGTLLHTITMVAEKEVYKQYKNPETGKPMRSIGEWLHSVFPFGPELAEKSKMSITLEDLLSLARTSGDKKAEGILSKHAGRKAGRPEKESGYNINQLNGKAKKGTSREYLLRRLQADHSDVYDEWLMGNYPSVRQAAIAAGIMKDTKPHDPLKRLKSNWRAATKKQREEFKRWLRTKDAK